MTGTTSRRDCTCPRAAHQHGTLAAYTRDRCRCLPCRAARANAVRVYRAGQQWRETLRDSTGTRRRLQALSAAGVTDRQIAAATGLTPDMVGWLRRPHPYVTARHAATVTAAYDDLWDKSRNDADARRCATQALRRGYVPPLAWDDDEIDDPNATAHTPADGRPELAPCGTPAAARRHYRHSEPLCEPCQLAVRLQWKARQAA